MLVQRPVLVASNAALAAQISAQLQIGSGRDVVSCSYENYQRHISWHRPGVLMLLATGNNGDVAHAQQLVQEAHLRRSPMNVAIVHDTENTNRLAPLDEYIECRAVWPEESEDLTTFVRDSSTIVRHNESVLDSLSSRIAQHTPSLLPHVNRLAMAAEFDVTLLLTGETGTGKTYLARLLHEHSLRHRHPFLMVPCGAQTASLFESTFFGHIRGAFTGANQTRVGRFAAAGKGTVLLDEIDALGLEQQASLLRVIETGEYEPVGGNETHHNEARIIVASNVNLEEQVAKGRFRQDLYYRLNVMTFHLPPLRNRCQDIPLLTRAIVARNNARFGKALFDISPDALAALEAYHWPGNVRQLENVLQEAVLVSSGPELMLRDLPQLVAADSVAEQSNGSSNGVASSMATMEPTTIPATRCNQAEPAETLLGGRATYERGLIQRTLVECNQNRSRAARSLGISRVTLYKKLKLYQLADEASR